MSSLDPVTLDPLGGRRGALRNYTFHPVVKYGAFAGLTMVKAEVINDALCGYVVNVVGGQHDSALWSNRAEYVFHSITLPGQRARVAGLSGPYELVLGSWDGHGGSFGASRYISAALIERFDVVPVPPLTPCWGCSIWLPQSELRDSGGWYAEPESRLECPHCYSGAI